ncbi:glycoside hydrolase family 17 protein [Backusella circina FSU 941]|nr:glycoside hydrolase family 17 protein [Backusella circina FSU 941]
MRFTAIISLAITLAGLTQALPIESRSGSSSLYGVTFSGHNSDGSCMSEKEITNSVHLMKSHGIKNIRTYSQECDQLDAILKAIKKEGGGMRVLAAVWLDGSQKDDQEISKLKAVLAKNKGNSAISGILVGNEVVFSGAMSASALVNKIKAVKKISHGFKVGTADITTSFSKELVAASDFLAANIHPFFGGVTEKDALSNLNAQVNNFKKIAGSKEILVTETGWPTAGSSNQGSKPSTSNAQKYAAALSKSKLKYYYFEWQDSDWKDGGQYNIEKNFGLINSNGKLKFSF